jgi:hypothetical protein
MKPSTSSAGWFGMLWLTTRNNKVFIWQCRLNSAAAVRTLPLFQQKDSRGKQVVGFYLTRGACFTPCEGDVRSCRISCTVERSILLFFLLRLRAGMMTAFVRQQCIGHNTRTNHADGLEQQLLGHTATIHWNAIVVQANGQEACSRNVTRIMTAETK